MQHSQWPVSDLGSGLHHVHFLKLLVCCLESNMCIHGWGVSTGIHKVMASPSHIPHSVIFPVFSHFLRLPFLVLWPETWVFIYSTHTLPVILSPFGAKQQKDREVGGEEFLTLFGPQLIWLESQVALIYSCRLPDLPLPPLLWSLSHPWIASGLGRERMEKGK